MAFEVRTAVDLVEFFSVENLSLMIYISEPLNRCHSSYTSSDNAGALHRTSIIPFNGQQALGSEVCALSVGIAKLEQAVVTLKLLLTGGLHRCHSRICKKVLNVRRFPVLSDIFGLPLVQTAIAALLAILPSSGLYLVYRSQNCFISLPSIHMNRCSPFGQFCKRLSTVGKLKLF